MSSSETLYTARFLLPELIELGRTQSLTCPVYRSGALVAPTSGTVSVYDATGAVIVSAAAVTIAGSVATYSLADTVTSSLSPADHWRVEWTLVIATITYVFRNDAALVRRRLWPVVTDADLTRRVTSLDYTSATAISSLTNYQNYLDEAWTEINLRLIANGNRPNLIIEPSALRTAHISLTLALIFEDLATRLNDAYQVQATSYRAHYADAWRALDLRYDASDSLPTEGTSGARRAVKPVMFLNGRGL